MSTPRGQFLYLEDNNPIRQDTQTGTGRGAAARWDVHTSTRTPLYTDVPLPFESWDPRSESLLNCPGAPLPHTSLPRASDRGWRVEGPWGVRFRCPSSRRLGKRQDCVGWYAGGRGESGGSLGCNPSAPVPWERRVRPAPYVKNSGEAGATASGGCWGAGVSRQWGPSFGDRTESWRGAGKGPIGPGGACAIPGVGRASPAPGPECASPIPGGFFVRGYPTHQAPGRRTLTPGRGFEASLAPACAAEPPMQAPGELRSNLTKLAAGCTGLYLAWGGVQGPRPPQLPGAPGCTTASARSPSGQSRPAPPPGPGEEPRPRPVPSRPAPPRQGSPGVPAPTPPPPTDFPHSSVDPLSRGLHLGWWWRWRGAGPARGKMGPLSSCVWIPSASSPAQGAPTLALAETT